MDVDASSLSSSSSSSSSSLTPPQFDSTFSTASHFFFYNTIDPTTASLTSNILGPNLTTTFTHSRAPALFPQATILTNLTKKTTGFLAFLPPGEPRNTHTHTQPTQKTRTILAWAESGHGHGPEGDLLDGTPSILPNTLWAKRVIKLSSAMGLNLGHPFDRLTRGGQKGIFRASHVEVKLATHAIYTLLRMYKIRHRGEAMTTTTLERLRRKIREASRPPNADANDTDAHAHAHADAGAGDGRGARPSFEIYFSKKNCHACADYVSRLSALTGVAMTLCWRDRLVRIEYEATRMGEPRLLGPPGGQDEEEPQGVITVEEGDGDGDDDDDEDDADIRMLDMVDLTQGHLGSATTDQPRDNDQAASPRLGSFLEGLAYCIGQGTRARVVKAVVGLARMRQRRRRRVSPAPGATAAARTSRRRGGAGQTGRVRERSGSVFEVQGMGRGVQTITL
ncbi:hypothetical protein E4U43_003947 [Claviceps pusilla]|uniref:Uncharacterized protein n=1 Tax=Claviceps pusilla TaxID=123648 RepID=A0A9P7SZD1_9HYPO|nr:hypothetical protein E4U43_003947 [Claviceps pusilla]